MRLDFGGRIVQAYARWIANMFRGSRRRQRRGTERTEWLEQRVLLSAIIVNSAADNTTSGDGLVTLREAIIAANTNVITDLGQTGTAGLDTITFGDGSAGWHCRRRCRPSDAGWRVPLAVALGRQCRGPSSVVFWLDQDRPHLAGLQRHRLSSEMCP